MIEWRLGFYAFIVGLVMGDGWPGLLGSPGFALMLFMLEFMFFGRHHYDYVKIDNEKTD